MRFDTRTKTTDLLMFNSQNLGALIVDKEPFIRSWDEPGFDIQNIGIEESYGFDILNEGQAIATVKNIKANAANETYPHARPTVSIGPDNTDFELPVNLGGANPIDVLAESVGAGR